MSSDPLLLIGFTRHSEEQNDGDPHGNIRVEHRRKRRRAANFYGLWLEPDVTDRLSHLLDAQKERWHRAALATNGISGFGDLRGTRPGRIKEPLRLVKGGPKRNGRARSDY